jgi:hypothetical protein
MSESKRSSRIAAEDHAETGSRAQARGKRRRARQVELDFRSWGGSRKGAGRKRKSDRPMVPHVARSEHTARFPVLVTSRLLPGLPSLRRAAEAECVLQALASSRHGPGEKRSTRKARRRAPPVSSFQVVHHSIQSNHLHLIVEATDRDALTAGMRGLLIRIARALNRLWSRRGRVFADRFHERELRTPREVRNALVYVLNNGRKHRSRLAGPDPLSSGAQFGGWMTDEDERLAEDRPTAPLANRGRAVPTHAARSIRFGGGAASAPVRTQAARATRFGGCAAGLGCPQERRWLERVARSECPRASTWLLAHGWKRHGWIDLLESPRGP